MAPPVDNTQRFDSVEANHEPTHNPQAITAITGLSATLTTVRP